MKFFSYFTQKKIIRLGSRRLDEIIPSDFIQMEVDEIWRCSYLVGMYASPHASKHLASIPIRRDTALNMDNMDSNKVSGTRDYVSASGSEGNSSGSDDDDLMRASRAAVEAIGSHMLVKKQRYMACAGACFSFCS